MSATYGVYKVTGKRIYRGHNPGTTFEALIDPAVEQRAIERGDITLLRRETPDLRPGSFRLPPGWLRSGTHEAPAGASLMDREERR